MTTNRIDDCLSCRDGRLFMEECDTVALVEQFGSPLFLVSEDQLCRNIRAYQQAFARRWTEGPVDVLPALKANWTLATRRILSREGAGADIYSEGELHAALVSGVVPERISVNGGGKDEHLIRKCLEAGVRITVEDLDEPDLIERVAREMGKTARIRFRVKPNFPNLWRRTDFSVEVTSIDMGIQVYKSGIPAQYLPELGRRALKMKNVVLVGLHFHGGRHHPSAWFWKGIAQQYARLTAELCAAWGGWRPQELDIGGGFASPRDPHNKLGLTGDVVLTWFLWPLQLAMRALPEKISYRLLSAIVNTGMVKSTKFKPAPTVDDYAEATVSTLHHEFRRLGFDTAGIRLQVEPGRGLYGNAGIHLARVKKLKRQTEPVKLNWVLTDTTCFFLAGGQFEYNLHDFVVANKTDAPPALVADIVGHSCFGDRLMPFVRVPELEAGDIIAFLDTGAYQEVSASNFNALPRPATILVTGDRAEVIKKAETIEDVFSRDLLPDHLHDY